MAIDPTPSDIQRFVSADDGTPIVMLNLLRFSDGGADRYREYALATQPFLAAVGGELLYAGLAGPALVADDGQSWDAVLLVRYPSRAAFFRMVSNPAYLAITHLRTSALREAVLQPTSAWRLG
jgi:uncharacterized protein (DUF1330 family)